MALESQLSCAWPRRVGSRARLMKRARAEGTEGAETYVRGDVCVDGRLDALSPPVQ